METEPVRIPHTMLSADTLQRLIEEFVTRDGADYGGPEVPLDVRVRQVVRQLEVGKAAIVFDEQSGTCNIVPVDPRRTGSST